MLKKEQRYSLTMPNAHLFHYFFVLPVEEGSLNFNVMRIDNVYIACILNPYFYLSCFLLRFFVCLWNKNCIRKFRVG